MLGVVQRREHLRFAREPGESCDVAGERVGQDFERDVTIQLRIARVIDLAHGPCTDWGDDLVGTEAKAGGEEWASFPDNGESTEEAFVRGI